MLQVGLGSALGSKIEFEREELAQIYAKRGIDHELALKVADQLMAKDAPGTDARDELGISEITTTRPIQAALTSAVTFAIGAAMPVPMVLISLTNRFVPFVVVASLRFLGLLCATGAKKGGADILKGTVRVTFWGALATAAKAGIGKLFGATM